MWKYCLVMFLFTGSCNTRIQKVRQDIVREDTVPSSPGYQEFDKTTIVDTDSSVIKSVCKAGSYKFVEEKFKLVNRVFNTRYYDDTLTINWSGYSDTLQNYFGVQNFYDRKTNIVMSIDHSNFTWNADTGLYPYFPLLTRVKARADATLEKYFGKEFARSCLRWDIFSSCYFAEKSSSPDFGPEWTREQTILTEPTRCYIVYNIVKDDEYRGQVRMLVDTAGRIQKSKLDQSGYALYNEGFKEFKEDEKKEYKLTIIQALKMAQALGLITGDSVFTDTEYKWERDKNPASYIFNGNTKLIISQSKKSDMKTQGCVTRMTGYTNQWIFDPWSGKFIGKRRIKNDL